MFRTHYKIEARPAQEFGYDAAISRLTVILPNVRQDRAVDMMVPGEDDQEEGLDETTLGFTRRKARALRLSSVIDVDCKTTIGCAGAVLTYIGRRRAINAIPSINGGLTDMFQVSDIEVYNLKDLMFVFSSSNGL